MTDATTTVPGAVTTTILGRRSIRREFTDRAVEEDVIEAITACGLVAPSSKNAQPWRLHVVTATAMLREIADAVQNGKDADTYVPINPRTGAPRDDWPSTVAESAEVLRAVPLGIFVENLGTFSEGRTVIATTSGETLAAALVGYTFEVIGLGAAIQNMWLAAASYGLVGVYMGDVVIADALVRERLGMRGDFAGVLALGYSDALPAFRRFYEPDRLVRHA